MSDAFILRAGGGGGISANNAVIHVTAPVGSTISFSKGGIVAKVLGPEKSHVSVSDASLAEWYFSVSPSNYGTWTVTATLNTDTASSSVTVNSNMQYNVELTYHYYLYNKGTQFPGRPGGGWDTNGASSSVFLSDRIHLFGGDFPYLSTVNKLSFRGWSKVAFRIVNANLDTEEGLIFFAGAYKYSSADGTFFNLIKITHNGTFYMDVSNLQSSTYYIEGYVYTNNKYADVEQIWLE